MTDTAKSWIEERQAIHAKATPGPWEVVPFSDSYPAITEVKVITKAEIEWDEFKDGEMPEVLGYDYEGYHSTVEPRDATATVDAHNEFPRALDALNKVLELHAKGYEAAGIHWCSECETKWPCATVQAIEGAIND